MKTLNLSILLFLPTELVLSKFMSKFPPEGSEGTERQFRFPATAPHCSLLNMTISGSTHLPPVRKEHFCTIFPGGTFATWNQISLALPEARVASAKPVLLFRGCRLAAKAGLRSPKSLGLAQNAPQPEPRGNSLHSWFLCPEATRPPSEVLAPWLLPAGANTSHIPITL